MEKRPGVTAVAAGERATVLPSSVESVLFLDLDGVVLPYGSGTPPKQYFQPDVRERIANPDERKPRSFQHDWSRELMEELSALFDSPKFQLVVNSTWSLYGVGLLHSMRVTAHNPILALEHSEANHERREHKVARMAQLLSTVDRPLRSLWVDDEAEAILKRSGLELPTDGLVSPDGRYGLSREELSRVSRFLRGVATEELA